MKPHRNWKRRSTWRVPKSGGIQGRTVQFRTPCLRYLQALVSRLEFLLPTQIRNLAPTFWYSPLTYVTNLMRKPVAVCQAQNAKQAATI